MKASLLLLLLSTAALAADAVPEPPAIRRFALVAGASDGGPGRVRLRYTGSDAQAVAQVLTELGGVEPGDVEVLAETDLPGLTAALARMRVRMARAGGPRGRQELLLYYSGHSDADGLLLRGERLDYAALRAALRDVPADVRIAILDSCASGALTRAKGGVRRPAFLEDLSSQVKGHAFLASSSENEVAQESDALGASFFTHFLLTGLRGAADVSGDGRVTLNEAYYFAFHETLARTEKSAGGPQHATYDIQLAGTGDLVMTDLRTAGARLRFGGELTGRLFVRDAQGRLTAELQKGPGRPLDLALAPGRYAVTLEREAQVWGAELTVPRSGYRQLSEDELVPLRLLRTVARGGPGQVDNALPHEPVSDVPTVPVNVSLVPGLDTNALKGPRALNHFALGLIAARSTRLEGLGLSTGVNWVDGTGQGVQLAALANVVGGEFRGLQAGAGNLVFGDATGLQLSPLLNSTEGAFTGVQFSSTVNRVGAGMRGLQVAVGLNSAQEVHGVQLGLLNISEGVVGAQVGLVNIGGTVRGLQLGLLNVSDDATVPIGLVSIVRQGRLSFQLWADDVAPVNVGLKYGGKHVYAALNYGVAPYSGTYRMWWGAGLGLHLDAGQGYVEGDLTAGAWAYRFGDKSPEGDYLTRARFVVGTELRRRFGVFAGLTVNLYRTPEGDDTATWVPQKVFTSGDHTYRLWPGLMAGIQI